MTPFDRITQDPAIMGGKACIRGLRVTVATIVGQIGAGQTIDEVLADYPYLEREDILQALRYAAWLAPAHVGTAAPPAHAERSSADDTPELLATARNPV